MLKRSKPYKAISPKLTIDKIRAIFVQLGFLYEEICILQSSSFVSYNLLLINPENKKPIFFTNGKGSSNEWALASAWGEMAERFQNLAYFMIQLYPSCPETGIFNSNKYKYYPDEKLIRWQNNDYGSLFKELITGKNCFLSNSFIGVPFLNVFKNKQAYLPFRFLQVIVGSNGMCSGNTKEEALIQGISEIFERTVLKEFYLNPFCPPDIPLELFKNFDIHTRILNLIKANNYHVQIKDCSLGKNYPVIGVLLKNNKNEYAFHLGADPSPVTALERCFTEMYQGGIICFKNIDESKRNSPCDLNNDFWKQSFSKTISAYAGHWPSELLDDSYSYDFEGFQHPNSISDKNDFEFLLNILQYENKDIYIRDNSFLGQPTYYIYIPGISEITNVPDDSFSSTFLEFDNYLPTLTNFYESTQAQRIQMLIAINQYLMVSPLGEFRAADYFAFFREHPVAKSPSGKIKELLSQEDDVKFKEVLTKINVPHCFNCLGCRMSDKCNFPFIKEIWEKVKTKMEMFYE